MIILILSILILVFQADDVPPDPDTIFVEGVQWELLPPPQLRSYIQISPTPTSLPSNIPENFYDVRFTVSPDGEHIVFSGRDSTLSDDLTYWVYVLDGDELILLGSIPNSEPRWNNIFFSEWVSNTQGAISFDTNHSSGWSSYYAFDVTQPDSLQAAFTEFHAGRNVIFADSHYIVLNSRDYNDYFTGSASHGECRLTQYDANGIYWENLGDDCLMLDLGWKYGYHAFSAFYQFNDDIYYLVVQGNETILYRRSTLIPDDVEMLYTGQIHNILSISSDYFIILEAEQIVIGNQSSGEIIYTLESQHDFPQDSIFWLDNSTFVMTEPTRGSSGPYELRRISLEDTVRVDLSPDLYASSQFVELMGRDVWLDGKRLINLHTFEELPVLRDGVDEHYNITILPESENTIIVFITIGDEVTRYRVYPLG